MKREEIAVILKSFDAPDEVRVMQKGKFERVHLGGITIGRATYEPGWKWSEHVGPSVEGNLCIRRRLPGLAPLTNLIPRRCQNGY